MTYILLCYITTVLLQYGAPLDLDNISDPRNATPTLHSLTVL